MFFKLSFRNMQRSFKDYTIYFLTLVLGVAIFYMFNSIESQTVMMDISSSTREIIKLMTNVLAGVSVFVSLILAFLIIYASRFLMKRRHKEFAIYMTLGMSKQQISFLLLCETFFIGVMSLVIGLAIGIALSQLMSIFVAGMFEVDMTSFEFIFSYSAMMKTILYFAIIYVVVMFFNVFFIGKQSLIDLFMSQRKNEQIKIKNLWLCSFIFVVAVGMLAYAYYLVTAGVATLDNANKIWIPIALGIVSTFMIFYSLSGFALKIMMSKKSMYYKNLNAFTMRQLSSQMNTTVFSMGMICLMLFMTICVLSSGISIKNSMSTELKEMTPVDIYMYKYWDLSYQKDNKKTYTQQEIDDSHIRIDQSLEAVDFSIDDYFKDVFIFNDYATNDLTMKDTLGKAYDDIHQQYPYLKLDTAESIMKISDYNQIAKRYGLETYTLNSDQYLIVGNFENMTHIRDQALKINTPIQLLNKIYYPKYDSCQGGYIALAANHTNTGIIIVPDDAVNESMRNRNLLIADYNAQDKVGKQAIEDKILSLNDQAVHIDAITKISIYENSVGLGAMVTFIAIYLGIIFLISSAAILALKQLSDSADNQKRYQMLRKIGVDEVMLNKALFVQIALFFMIPLILAIIHSIFGIQFCGFILQTFGSQGLLTSIIMTALFIVLIYGGYMIVTYKSSQQMIKD